MKMPKISSDRFWKLIVVVLLVLVAVQLYLLRSGNAPATVAELTVPTPTPVAATPPAPVPLSAARASANTLPAVKPLPSLRPTTPAPAGMPQLPIVQATNSSRRPGINPYDQPQVLSGADMFAAMQQMARQMMLEMDRNMPMPQWHDQWTGMDNFAADNGPTLQALPDKFVVKMALPGLNQSNIKARVDGNMLTISGRLESQQNRNRGNYRSYTGSSSQFQTSLYLPGPVKTNGMKTDYRSDELTVTIPRA
ncbi:MAG: Hsp20 family protein [Victivallales bacterium]|nr:Hsp20 family protein [Victivallales bacterium]